MLTRCMLPISIVENEGFKEYIEFLDPSFQMPSRRRIKEFGLPNLKIRLQSKIKDCLKSIPWINASVDLWTDAAVRPFNGYIAQGIDNNWVLHTIPIEFEPIIGNFC